MSRQDPSPRTDRDSDSDLCVGEPDKNNYYDNGGGGEGEGEEDWMTEVEDVRLLLEEEFDMENKCDRSSCPQASTPASPPTPRPPSKRTGTQSQSQRPRGASRPPLPAKASSLPAKISLSSCEYERADAALRLLATGVGVSGGRRGLTLQRESKRRSYAGRSA